MKFFHTGDIRSDKIKMNAIKMYFYRIGGILINFLYVPLLINNLEVESYGVWLTLTSITSWFAFFDIGLGNGMRNKLAESLARNEIRQAREYVSTTYILMAVISIGVSLLCTIIIPFLNWQNILNVKSVSETELTQLALVVVILFVFQLVLKLITSVLYAVQEPAESSKITFLSQLMGLVAVWWMGNMSYSFSLLDYGLVISICPVFVMLVYSYYLFSSKYSHLSPSRSYYRKVHVRDVANVGIQFFFIQLTSVFLLHSNSFIIAQMVNPEAVVDYNIGYKYLSIPLMAFTVITTPIWSATTDAYVRKDTNWIKACLNKLTKLFLLFSLIVILLLAATPMAYHIWLKESIAINWPLMITITVYQICNMRTAYTCAVINGIGKVRLQFYITFIESLIHIPLAVVLAKYYGIIGVVASMALMTFINAIWEPIQIKKLINYTAHGIWNK